MKTEIFIRQYIWENVETREYGRRWGVFAKTDEGVYLYRGCSTYLEAKARLDYAKVFLTFHAFPPMTPISAKAFKMGKLIIQWK